MIDDQPSAQVRRIDERTYAIDLAGDFTRSVEEDFLSACAQAAQAGASQVVLNFKQVEYMNSAGVGLLIKALVSARRQGITLVAVELREHLRNILEITNLDQALLVYANEASALSGTGSQPPATGG